MLIVMLSCQVIKTCIIAQHDTLYIVSPILFHGAQNVKPPWLFHQQKLSSELLLLQQPKYSGSNIS
ncbi:hypothetical protein HanIR_Chr04g0163571 [Helianthus annuus]|nr:hypothetical protein HanIR_Chr04g0163571 [Helianthus annuus]